MEVPEPRTVTWMGAKGMIDQMALSTVRTRAGAHAELAMDALLLWLAWLGPQPLD